MKKWITVSGILGLVLTFYGLISAIFYSNVNWYAYFVIGGTFFLGYINYLLKNESIFEKLEKDKKKSLKTYLYYVIAGLGIELVGRFLFHLWSYPSLSGLNEIIQVIFIFYPFGLSLVYESFILIKKFVKSFKVTIIVATLINAFVHEVPNTFVWEWKYTIPYITFEVLQINIVVIIGWVILITVPLIGEKILK